MRIVFMGTPEFAVPSLDMLVKEGYNIVAVITQPDKPKGRGKKLAFPPIKEYALSKGIDVLQPEKVRTPEFVKQLKEMGPDLLITAAYGRILSKEVLGIPPMGCINIHGSLLPRYRGAAPIHWAIINGEAVTGITTMYTDVGMDTGDMLLKKQIDIPDDMTVEELHDKMAVLGAEVLSETLKKLKDGTLERIPQIEEEATYAPIIKKDIGHINWNKSAQEIHNLVRGTNPWPGAFTFYKGERLKIWRTRVVGDSGQCLNGLGTTDVKPGTICKIMKESIIVATGCGFIEIKEVQFDSCKRMGIYECGHNIDEGEVLG